MTYTDVFGGALIFPTRVSYNSITTSVDVVLQWPTEQQIEGVNVVADVIDVNTTAGGLNIDMPDARNTSTGNKATFNNVGGVNAFTVRDATGGTIQSVNPGEQWVLVLTDNTTEAGAWTTFQLGGNAATQASASALAGDGLQPTGNQLDQIIDSDVEASTPFDVVTGDRAKCLIYTAGAGTCNLQAQANNFFVMLHNAGSGTLNIVPAAGTIDGSPNINLDPNGSSIIFTDGTDWYTVGLTVASTIAFDFVSIAVPGSGDFTLTGANLDRISYRFTGALTGNRRIIVPNTTQQYWVDNQTTGAFTLEVTTAAGSGQIISQNNSAITYCDATDVINAVSSTSVTFPITIGQGGTSATTASGARTNLNAAFDGIEIQTNADSGLSGGGDLTANRPLLLDINNLDDTPTIANTDSIAFEDSDDNITYKATLSDLSAAIQPDSLVDSGGNVRAFAATGSNLQIRSDTDSDVVPRRLQFTHQDQTVRGYLGWNSFSEEMSLVNSINANDADIILSVTNSNAVITLNTKIRISSSASTQGISMRGTANNNATLRWTDTSFFGRASIGYNSSDVFQIISSPSSGANMEFIGEDLSTITRTMMILDPDVGPILQNDNVEIARALAPASGGFQVNNLLTGGGDEPVATVGEAAGSFVATWGGFSSDPNVTVLYRIISNIAIVTFDVVSATGTSNATTFTITNVPAALQPGIGGSNICFIPGAIDNGSNINGMTVDVQAGLATWLFGAGLTNPGGGGWTAAGSKGFATGDQWTIIYRLDA